MDLCVPTFPCPLPLHPHLRLQRRLHVQSCMVRLWGLGPPYMINTELGEEHREQVHILLAQLQATYNSNTTTFGEDEVIATAKTYRLMVANACQC